MLPEQAPGVFSDGCWVRLKGLAARPELNGHAGQILSFNPERSRYAVQLHSSGERILLRPASLELAMDPGIASTAATATEQWRASREGQASTAASAADGVEAFDAACELLSSYLDCTALRGMYAHKVPARLLCALGPSSAPAHGGHVHAHRAG